MRKKIKKEALLAFVNDFPNSVVADLLMHFDKEVVVKLVEFYSGRQLTIPTVKTVWTSYRNRIIASTLKKEDTGVVRERLASNFGLTNQRLSEIYSHAKKTRITRVKDRTITNIVDTIFKKNFKKYNREVKILVEVLEGGKPSLHDVNQNPEVLFLIKEQRKILIEQCVEDLDNHLVFSDRVFLRQRAVSLCIRKIEELLK